SALAREPKLAVVKHHRGLTAKIRRAHKLLNALHRSTIGAPVKGRSSPKSEPRRERGWDTDVPAYRSPRVTRTTPHVRDPGGRFPAMRLAPHPHCARGSNATSSPQAPIARRPADYE